MATLDEQLKNIITAITDGTGKRTDLETTKQDTLVQAINQVLEVALHKVIQIGGAFLLDPNEMNAPTFYAKSTGSYKMETSTGTSFNRKAGGVSFPYDVKVKALSGWYRVSSSSAKAWGWVIFAQTKTNNSTSKSNAVVLHEVNDNGGDGPRDHRNTKNQYCKIDINSGVIPAGTVITIGVAAPTAQSTNYRVYASSMIIEVERVLS